MNSRSGGTAWALWSAAAVLTLGALVLQALYQARITDLHTQTLSEVAGTLAAMSFPTVGAAILSRRPGNRIGWLLCIVGVGWQVEAFTGAYATYGLASPSISLPLAAEVAVFADSLWLPTAALALVFFFVLFPDGRLISTRWRIVLVLATVASLSWVAGTLVDPGPLYFAPEVLNPFGLSEAGAVTEVVLGVSLMSIGTQVIAALVCLVIRIRRSRADERHQLKWFTYAAGMTVATVPVAIAFTDSPFGAVPLELAPAMLAAAIGVAILRYRLYDIDRLVNRTIVYSGVTLILAGGYVFGALSIRSLLPLDDDSPLIVAMTTLAVLAAFRPLRDRLQETVDRRFNRARHDAGKTVELFGARLRDEVNLDELTTDLIQVTRRALQPSHVSLWLRQMESS